MRRLNELEPGVIPAGLAFVVFVVLGAKDAGYAASTWYLAALFLVALLAVSLWALRGTGARLRRSAFVSVGFLAALTLWTYASIAWSDAKGDAFDGANRSLLYLVVYVLFLFLAPSARAFAGLVAGYVLAVAALGFAELVEASRAANPDVYFLVARFAEPTGYQNANCALFSLAFWPALFLASRRELPVLVRALMLGASGVCVELAVLSQSRGWLAAMPVVFVLYIALVPGRVRSLVFTIPVAVAAVAAEGRLLDVYSALREGVAIRSSLDDACVTIAVSAVVLALVGAALAVADRRLDPDSRPVRRLTFAAAAAFAAAGLVALVVALVWLGNPATRVRDAWEGFKGPPHVQGSYLTSGFSSNRYDLWRVAWGEFKDHPVAGVGSDQFAVDYVRERRSHEEPLYPHSVELKVLAQGGMVGGVLFLGWLVAAVAAWARPREESAFGRSLRAAALVAVAYWLVHGSVDWFWELSGLGAPAIAFLAFAVGGGAARRDGRSRGFGFAAVPVLGVAFLLFGVSWLAAKEVRAAAGQWRSDPAAAFVRLDRARQLNPLSDWPDVVAGVIASRVGDEERMIASFRRALDRNPSNWYSHLELAVAYGRRGDRAAALRELRRVERLNPREPTIELVRDGIRTGRPVSTRRLDTIFLRRNVVSNRDRPK